MTADRKTDDAQILTQTDESVSHRQNRKAGPPCISMYNFDQKPSRTPPQEAKLDIIKLKAGTRLKMKQKSRMEDGEGTFYSA